MPLKNHRLTRVTVWLALVLALQLPLFGGEGAHVLPDDPAVAWKQLQKLQWDMISAAGSGKHEPNPEQKPDHQTQVCRLAAGVNAAAREFLRRFPSDENANDARYVVVRSLRYAAEAGDDDAVKQRDAFVAAVLADKGILEDDRARVCMYALGSRAALAQFPSNSIVYTALVVDAKRAKGDRKRELLTEILNAPGAPPNVKSLANHLLEGTKPYQVGKPLDIRFTALGGREVDLVKMKGKVVLIEFWSTRCGPCIAEMPTVRAVYEKFHDRGFEIVGISLDEKEKDLRRFVQEKGLPWPQYFDGKGPENAIAVRFGVFEMPVMWLVDKNGNLRDTEARMDLEGRVKALLDEKEGDKPGNPK